MKDSSSSSCSQHNRLPLGVTVKSWLYNSHDKESYHRYKILDRGTILCPQLPPSCNKEMSRCSGPVQALTIWLSLLSQVPPSMGNPSNSTSKTYHWYLPTFPISDIFTPVQASIRFLYRSKTQLQCQLYIKFSFTICRFSIVY